MRNQKGFTIIEFLLVISIAGLLFGFATLNLVNVQRETSLTSTVDVLVGDLREQQMKAMVGDTEGGGSNANYGIRFDAGEYTLFRGTYGTANYVIKLPGFVDLTTTFPGNQIVFLKGSGEIFGFTTTGNTIILTDGDTGDQTTVSINKYGVVTGVN